MNINKLHGLIIGFLDNLRKRINIEDEEELKHSKEYLWMVEVLENHKPDIDNKECLSDVYDEGDLSDEVNNGKST